MTDTPATVLEQLDDMLAKGRIKKVEYDALQAALTVSPSQTAQSRRSGVAPARGFLWGFTAMLAFLLLVNALWAIFVNTKVQETLSNLKRGFPSIVSRLLAFSALCVSPSTGFRYSFSPPL